MRNAFGKAQKIILEIYSITLTNNPESIIQNNIIKMFDPWLNRRKSMSMNLNIFRVKEPFVH